MELNIVSPSKDYLQITPIDSGVDYINKLFYVIDYRENKLKVLGGYPSNSVINITGEADTGKSLLCQLATVANSPKKLKTLYISVENPSSYVSNSLRRLALLKKIDYERIIENVKILDLSNEFRILDNIEKFFRDFYNLGKGFNICIFDSVTGLYENREVMARYVVRRIFQISKSLRLTCFLVSQKREDSPFSTRSAGGLAISHIADCNIVLSKIIVSSFTEKKIYGVEVGDIVRIFRIDGCRLCGHSSKNHFFKINEYGYIIFENPQKTRSEE